MGQASELTGRRVLIVEDDFVIANALAILLQSRGADVVGPVGDLDEALALLEADGVALDYAVVDVNLHGRTSYPVADILTRRGVRFVFTTGYDTGSLDARYADHPRCLKPFVPKALLAALAGA